MESESHPSTNWLELPREVTAAILSRVNDFDIVRSAQFVCSSWRGVARDPLRWRTIDMRVLGRRDRRSEFLTMCLRAVDYSSGHLESIAVDGFGSDHLLLCIAQRSKHIKCLRLRNCDKITDDGFCAAVAKLPLLEELELTRGSFSIACIEAAGRHCPRLKSLTFRRRSEENISASLFPSSEEWLLNDEAIAIASNLPGLRNLDIAGNGLTDAGVEAVLEGCPCLETLDLRGCFNVHIGGDLHTRCEEKLRHLWLPFSHSFRSLSHHSDDESDENQPYVEHDNDDRRSRVSGFSHNADHQSRNNECSERDEDESSESDHEDFSELEGNESEYPYASSDDDFSDVSDNESFDVSDDEFSESDDLGDESSGPEDSHDDHDHSDNSEYSDSYDGFSASSDDDI